jgi:hypothetical protein
MTERTDHLELAGWLNRARARWARHTALAAVANALRAAAIMFVFVGIADRALTLSDTTVLTLAIALAAAVMGAAIAFAWPLRRRPDDRRVARLVEERHPECADAVATAVDLSREPVPSSGFAPLVIASATRQLRALDPGDIVDPASARRVRWSAVISAAAIVSGTLLAWPFLARTIEIGSMRLFPGSVRLTVESGDMRVPAGQAATIVAQVRGRAGTLDRITARVTLDASGQTLTLPMERSGDGYRFQVPRVDRSFHYMVSAGPASSRAYAVTALHPPRVQRIDLQYDFPSFTGLTPRLDRDSGDVYGPAGTRVRVLVHTDAPVHDGALTFSAGPAAPLARVDERTLAASLTIDGERAYRVGLVDGDGLASQSVEYFVRVMDDRPPDVHIMRPAGDESITPLQEVPIEARANDDFGIARMELVYSVAGGPEHVVPFSALTGSDVARVGTRMLAAEDLKVKPGDVIAYYARAWDVPRATRATLARSEMFFLEVTPFNQEFELAQSQAGMQAATATQLDGLVAAQKEIISATWNLERRSGAGTSSRDVKGVADAQIELKARAERAAGAARQRRRFGGFQQMAAAPQRPPMADDPVIQAVEAMGKAAQQLQSLKTADAMPHEMAALNALLRAQAEIRRRQVAQQRSNGGGGFGNRQSQDLSSLFDRELQRQQRTNYEEQSTAERPAEQKPGESALGKIRDLARRQEELTRQQRDLAARGETTEAAKRELEKLTREQEQLRQQLERMARNANGDARNAAAQPDVQQALERMRESARQGQQADAAGAAATGQQAAEALRRAEARIESGSAESLQRALGDLQLEAQQIAQEQRRIADAAARLDREQGGTADARRRLAGDKDRLADRVDALQQAAQRLPTTADAARDMAAQKLGDRMRATAQQWRAQAGRDSAAAEQQMADALDRVARAMSGRGADGARGDADNPTERLADQVDALRDARDRLARLERQLRDARDSAGARTGQPADPGGRSTAGRDAGGRAGGDDTARLQQQLQAEAQRARELLQGLERAGDGRQSGGRAGTPASHEWSRSAPGTEAFKQDYSGWQSLSADVARALERAESSSAARLAAALARDRLRAGGSERVPDGYERQVSRYFESIAAKKQP